MKSYKTTDGYVQKYISINITSFNENVFVKMYKHNTFMF